MLRPEGAPRCPPSRVKTVPDWLTLEESVGGGAFPSYLLCGHGGVCGDPHLPELQALLVKIKCDSKPQARMQGLSSSSLSHSNPNYPLPPHAPKVPLWWHLTERSLPRKAVDSCVSVRTAGLPQDSRAGSGSDLGGLCAHGPSSTAGAQHLAGATSICRQISELMGLLCLPDPCRFLWMWLGLTTQAWGLPGRRGSAPSPCRELSGNTHCGGMGSHSQSSVRGPVVNRWLLLLWSGSLSTAIWLS